MTCVLPASRAFSRSSFSALAGRWITSPAAILFTTTFYMNTLNLPLYLKKLFTDSTTFHQSYIFQGLLEVTLLCDDGSKQCDMDRQP